MLQTLFTARLHITTSALLQLCFLQALAVAWVVHLVLLVVTSCQQWLACWKQDWAGCLSWRLRQQESCCQKWCTCSCPW
jgi:hypothetical protein